MQINQLLEDFEELLEHICLDFVSAEEFKSNLHCEFDINASSYLIINRLKLS